MSSSKATDYMAKPSFAIRVSWYLPWSIFVKLLISIFAPDAVKSVVVTEKDFVGSNPEKVNVGTALRQAGLRITLKGMLKGIASIPILTFADAGGFYVKVID